MTRKEKAFVMEYITTFPPNQTEAARKAGYSEKSAGRIASRLMNKPDIRAAITARFPRQYHPNIATPNEILEILTSIVRGETMDNVKILKSGRMESVTAPCRTIDRLKAAELLCRYYGLFENRHVPDINNCGTVITLSCKASGL